MATEKIAITMDTVLLEKLDRLVRGKWFTNRSQAIQAAVRRRIEQMEKIRLVMECKKLDPKFERALAEEGGDLSEWPEY